MPKTVTKSATAKTAYGNELPTPIDFTYDYVELLESDDIPADEQPDAKEILALVNTKRNAAARSAAQNATFTAANIKKPTLEDVDVALATIVRAMVAQKIPLAQAQEFARKALRL